MLYDDDLKSLKVDFTNKKGAYYIVNYDNGEVIYTSGIEGKYKVSEMVNEVVESSSTDFNAEELGEPFETEEGVDAPEN